MEKSAKFIAAPVFGVCPVSAEGKLLWTLAEPNDAVKAISPLLVGVMGRPAIQLDKTCGSLAC